MSLVFNEPIPKMVANVFTPRGVEADKIKLAVSALSGYPAEELTVVGLGDHADVTHFIVSINKGPFPRSVLSLRIDALPTSTGKLPIMSEL